MSVTYEFFKKICTHCSWGAFEDHPEMGHIYDKCPICGYCQEKDLERLRVLRERQKDYELK